MKKYLFILLFTPISVLSQNPFPMIEYFPFSHDIFSTPIQLNSLNLFTPRINPTCPIQGKASTYYNFYSFQIGDTLSEYSSYTPYFPNSIDSENLDSMSASGFINGIQVDFGNAETSFSMAGSVGSPSLTYVFDNNGSLLYYNYAYWTTMITESYFYDENGFLILKDGIINNLFNPVEEVYELQWDNINQTCSVTDSIGLISIYKFDSEGKLLNYSNFANQSSSIDSVNFVYNNDNLITQSTFSYENSGQIIYDYMWIDENNVEMTINDLNSESSILNVDGQIVYKVLYELDSSLYAKNITYLDSNLNEIIRYKYHFCEDDTVVYGCTNSEACNFNLSANYDNGLCLYFDICGECGGSGPEYGLDCNGDCIEDIDLDGICDVFEVGCTDVLACNYEQSALTDDGSCVYAELYYTCDGDCLNDFDLDGVCDELDNCIDISNSDQDDIDEDDEGDACDYDDGIGIDEISEDTPKLIKMIDLLGREYTKHQSGMLLYYIYDNGKIEKKFIP